MNNEKLLSGYDLVSKGATKIEATLPEIGIKNVFSSGSWLEQKQIQAAVEARKKLIEVERIEKNGALSHAVWREELMLAEVTQKVGSYWQYLGHNKGKQLFLNPEEALFLMEVNCLNLKFHDIKVSLQQAYSLLLRDKVTHLQYKVYASLSRLGYRVYRHEISEPITKEKKDNLIPDIEKINNNNTRNNNDNKNNTEGLLTHQDNSRNKTESKSCIQDPQMTEQNSEDKSNTIDGDDENIINKNKAVYGLKKLQKLMNRVVTPCNIKHINKFFENLPELTNKQIVSIKTPDKEYIPNNINLNKPVFNVNLHNIQSKNNRSESTDTNIYTNDEVNSSHIRRLRNSSSGSESVSMPPYSNFAFDNAHIPYRQFNFWRPRQNYNSINFNTFLQRQFFWGFNPQFSRIQTQFWQTNFNNINRNLNNTDRNIDSNINNRNCNNPNNSFNNKNFNNKKRSRAAAKKQNLDEIKKLASRLKELILSKHFQKQHILSLKKLIHLYNIKYKSRIRLNEDFNIINEETIVDTIDLDDDEEPTRKKRRTVNQNHKRDNLNMVKNIASKLEELEKNHKSSARHRRAFSKLLGTFNKSYNEEYYLSESYEIENRQQITLDTSDSSSPVCLTEETKSPKRKKLKNPFNILKRLSERQKHSCNVPSTSRNDNYVESENKEYSQFLLKTFTRNWLPSEDDFGRAEVVVQEDIVNEITDIKKEEFLFDFLKIRTCNYDNWLDLKKSFFTCIKEAITEFQSTVPAALNDRSNFIVKPEDCADMTSVLKKLRIIRTANEVDEECSLAIDFDVFNRDVQNFRKTKRPTPHFRIVCFDETKHIPSGKEIASLHSKYGDNVNIVFAIVGVESISYMQINPTDLPVYLSHNA